MGRAISVIVMIIVMLGCLVGYANAEGSHTLSNVTSCEIAGLRQTCAEIDNDPVVVTNASGVLDGRLVTGEVTEVTYPSWWGLFQGTFAQNGSTFNWNRR